MTQSGPRDEEAFTIIQFCEAHHISRSMYYKQVKLGEGPRLMQVGRRRMISNEAAADWRRRMEKP